MKHLDVELWLCVPWLLKAEMLSVKNALVPLLAGAHLWIRNSFGLTRAFICTSPGMFSLLCPVLWVVHICPLLEGSVNGTKPVLSLRTLGSLACVLCGSKRKCCCSLVGRKERVKKGIPKRGRERGRGVANTNKERKGVMESSYEETLLTMT